MFLLIQLPSLCSGRVAWVSWTVREYNKEQRWDERQGTGLAREGAPTASSYSKRREARNEDIFESLYQQPLTNSASSQTSHSVQPVSPARCWPWFGLMLITRTAHLLSLSDYCCTPGRVGDAFNIQNHQVCVPVCMCVCTCAGSRGAKIVGERNFQPS